MHFVGMLAFSLPVQVPYNLSTIVLSVIVAVIASFVALYIIGRRNSAIVVQRLHDYYDRLLEKINAALAQ